MPNAPSPKLEAAWRPIHETRRHRFYWQAGVYSRVLDSIRNYNLQLWWSVRPDLATSFIHRTLARSMCQNLAAQRGEIPKFWLASRHSRWYFDLGCFFMNIHGEVHGVGGWVIANVIKCGLNGGVNILSSLLLDIFGIFRGIFCSYPVTPIWGLLDEWYRAPVRTPTLCVARN